MLASGAHQVRATDSYPTHVDSRTRSRWRASQSSAYSPSVSPDSEMWSGELRRVRVRRGSAQELVTTLALGDVREVRDTGVIATRVGVAIDRRIRARCRHTSEPGTVVMVNLPCRVAACGPLLRRTRPASARGSCDLCERSTDELAEFAVQGANVVAFAPSLPRVLHR